jgi:hypothetical protein
MSDKIIGTGKSFSQLANAISDAIFDATQRGMDLDEACCVVVAVAADFARGHYGNEYLPSLADVVTERRNHALPEGMQ